MSPVQRGIQNAGFATERRFLSRRCLVSGLQDSIDIRLDFRLQLLQVASGNQRVPPCSLNASQKSGCTTVCHLLGRESFKLTIGDSLPVPPLGTLWNLLASGLAEKYPPGHEAPTNVFPLLPTATGCSQPLCDHTCGLNEVFGCHKVRGVLFCSGPFIPRHGHASPPRPTWLCCTVWSS